MKTIYTTLPVYDSLSKQCYYRSGDDKKGLRGPVQTPRHRLPSMQWNVGTTNPGYINSIKTVNLNTLAETSILSNFARGPAFNLAWTWTNSAYDAFTLHADTPDYFDATKTTAAGVAKSQSDIFTTTKNESIYVSYNCVINSGTAPKMAIYDGVTLISNIITLTNATNVYCILTPTTTSANAQVWIYNSNTELANYSFSFYLTRSVIPSLITDLTNDYFQYNGDTLSYLLTAGFYYLKITTENGYVYYSEVFEVTCIYENLITAWTNVGYETLTTSGTAISSAINNAGTAYCRSDLFSVIKGEVITIIFYYTANSGAIPTLYLANSTWTVESSSAVVAGLNVINLTSTWDGDSIITLYNGTNSSYVTTEIVVIRQYSEEYLRIDFHNDCDLGELLYQDGFTQTLWIKGDNIETTFPMTPEGSEDGNGKFIPTFRRQEKIYLIKTGLVSLALMDCLYRLMLHETVTMIDLVGDSWTIENLEVEHDWQGDDKYYALATLKVDLGEAVVIAGCCNDQT